jgi:flagellar biosynthesis protein FlhA
VESGIEPTRPEDVVEEAPPVVEDGPSRQLEVDPLAIEVGVDLLYLVDASAGTALTDRIQKIRSQFAKDLGVVLPAVHIRDNLQLPSGEYTVLVRGEEVGRGQVRARKHLALDPGTATGAIRGIETVDPVYGLKGYWIADNQVLKAQAQGFTVVDVPTVLTTHFVELMHASTPTICTTARSSRGCSSGSCRWTRSSSTSSSRTPSRGTWCCGCSAT